MREGDDELYIVMELLDSDLHRIIQSKQTLSEVRSRVVKAPALEHGVAVVRGQDVICDCRTRGVLALCRIDTWAGREPIRCSIWWHSHVRMSPLVPHAPILCVVLVPVA